MYRGGASAGHEVVVHPKPLEYMSIEMNKERLMKERRFNPQLTICEGGSSGKGRIS
jgi:hypothetical protein